MSIAFGVLNQEGVVLAADGLFSTHPGDAPEGQGFAYLEMSKVWWFPGKRAACSIVGSFVSDTDSPKFSFGLNPDPPAGGLGPEHHDVWDFRKAVIDLYARLDAAQLEAIAWHERYRPQYLASIHPDWAHPSLLAVAYTGRGPRMIRIDSQLSVHEAQLGECIPIGGWDDDFLRRVGGSLPWQKTGTPAGAKEVVLDLMAAKIDDYEYRYSRGGPRQMGYPIFVATIMRDGGRLEQFPQGGRTPVSGTQIRQA